MHVEKRSRYSRALSRSLRHPLIRDRPVLVSEGVGAGGAKDHFFACRAFFGTRIGQLTMWSSSLSSEISFSVPLMRPRTETPATCTVSGSPDTSGCHQ